MEPSFHYKKYQGVDKDTWGKDFADNDAQVMILRKLWTSQWEHGLEISWLIGFYNNLLI